LHFIVDAMILEALVYPEYQLLPNLLPNVFHCRHTRYRIDVDFRLEPLPEGQVS